MKELFNKKNIYKILIIFGLLFLFHLPLMTKNIVTADVLLNNFYYEGYSWEISLGRFGTFLVGLLKSYISFPHIDLIFSYIILSITIVLLLDLFEIEDRISSSLIIIFLVVSPVISATLLFHFWNIVYFLAFFLGVSSIYLYYKWDHKIGRYVLPILFITASLSFYQAYLSLIVTLFVLYNIKLILNKKIDYKKSFKYIGLLFTSVILYFILMKLSQLILHIDMASYSNANSIGFKTILDIPLKIICSYKLFYQFYFTDLIMKNKFFHNNILNLLLIIIFLTTLFNTIYKSKIKRNEKFVLIILTFLIPIFLNSVIFVISDAKLQLLMSASYLIIPVFFISLVDKKYFKVIILILLAILLRNYSIQDQATYMSLENTFNQYKTIIGSTINNNINNLDKQYVVFGNLNKDYDPLMKNVYKRNYGYIADTGIFWDEYYLRKLNFERFVSEYFGIKIHYIDENSYKEVKNNRNKKDVIYEIDNVVVIDLDNYSSKKEN